MRPFEKFDYALAKPVAGADLDHCFADWDRRAEIFWPDRPLALELTASDSLTCVVVCIRSDLDVFCFEPVPHINDAVNRSVERGAIPVIAPGESFKASILLRAVEREPD